MLLDALRDFLRAHLTHSHLHRLWNSDLGVQTLFANGDRRRIPQDGHTRAPHFDDTPYHPVLTPESVLAVGVNGWNWVNQRSEFVTFDLDSVVNHTKGVPIEQLDEVVARLMAVDDVEIVRSKSGHGYHARVYFDPHPRAITHNDHSHNAKRVLAWLSQQIDYPLATTVDAAGLIAWIWHQKTAPNGFELLKHAKETKETKETT